MSFLLKPALRRSVSGWKALLSGGLRAAVAILLSLRVPLLFLLRCEPHLLTGQTCQADNLLVASSQPSVAIPFCFVSASFWDFLGAHTRLLWFLLFSILSSICSEQVCEWNLQHKFVMLHHLVKGQPILNTQIY